MGKRMMDMILVSLVFACGIYGAAAAIGDICTGANTDCTLTGEICGTEVPRKCVCNPDGYVDNSGTCVATDITQAVGTDVTVTTALGTVSNKDGTTTLTLKEDYATTITTFTLRSASMTGPFTWTSGNNKLQVSATGAVTLASALDYETEPVVTAVLKAVDSTATTPNTATVSLTLSLTDVNDNKPIFNPATYTDRVANGATAGTVTTVTATDADGTAANKVITYSITGGNTGVAWEINPTTGVISVASGKTINSTPTPSYSLTVTATDSGSPAKSETVTVNINVATACTSDAQCNSGSFEDCSTVNSANVCKCQTGYTDNAGTCQAKAACTTNSDCTSANNEACTTITGGTKACRCKADYTDNGGTCLSDCPSVPTQQNGAIGAGSNSVGSTRTVTCDSDYTLTGLATITCKTDSTWETPGTCNGAVSMLAGMILLSLSSLVAMVIHI